MKSVARSKSHDGGYAGRGTARLRLDPGISPGQTPGSAEYGHERLPSTPVSVSVRKRRGRGPGRLGLDDLLSQLSPRDLAVIDLIAEHRFLTTRHLEAFCFHDHATPTSGARVARRVLARLERDGLIERAQRRIGGLHAGSGSTIWMPTSIGQRLRAMRNGQGAVGKVREPSERFIRHYLAIADTRLTLVQAERAGLLVVQQCVIEPRSWRNYTGLSGAMEVLKPDLAAITLTSKQAEFEDHWFIEVDLGTESLPTLLKQCERYESYRRSGQAQADNGVFPIIVWIVPDERRATNLTQRIASSRQLNTDYYRVTTPAGLLQVLCGNDPDPELTVDHRGGEATRGRA